MQKLICGIMALMLSAYTSFAQSSLIVDDLTVNNSARIYGSLNLTGVPIDVISNNLALYYSFSNNVAPVDLSTNNNAGNISNAVWSVNGFTNGGCFTFSGTNQWVETATNRLSLNLTNELTVLAWIKLATAISNTTPMILTKGPSSGASTNQSGNYELSIRTNGTLYFSSQYTTAASQGTGGVTRVDNLNWHMVSVTVDATNKFVKLYVDGQLDASVTMANKPIAYTNAEPVRIGRRKDGNFFVGSIDEVRVYGRVLSPTEISQLYAYFCQTKKNAILTVDGINQSDASRTNIIMGSLGIGTNATSGALTVAGTVSASSFAGNGSSLTNIAGANIAGGTIGTDKLNLGSVDARYVVKSGDTMAGALAIPGNGLAVGGTQLVTSAGNVGVGTATPTEKLQVSGNILVNGGAVIIDTAAGDFSMGSFTNKP